MTTLEQLTDRLDALSHVPERVAERVPDELAAAVRDEFDAGADPYGSPWVPTKSGAPPLAGTGAMRAGVRATPAGVAVPFPPPQVGWSGPRSSGPARPVLPDHGLPEAWENIIFETAEDEFHKAVSK